MARSNWKLHLSAIGVAGIALAAMPVLAKDVAPAGTPKAETTAAPLANTLTEKEKADGWKSLFDGKSADQWRGYKKTDLPKGWKVMDGELVRKEGGGDIITKEKYDSYELVLDYKITKGGNSGLIFHVLETDGPSYQTGPEVQIQDNVDGHDPQKAGWLYQLYQPPMDEKTKKPIDATKPVGEWNTLRLQLDGPKGEITMNGVKYANFELWSQEWNEKVAKSKFGKMKGFGEAKSGFICLQDHGNEVAFRNIKIRPISAK